MKGPLSEPGLYFSLILYLSYTHTHIHISWDQCSITAPQDLFTSLGSPGPQSGQVWGPAGPGWTSPAQPWLAGSRGLGLTMREAQQLPHPCPTAIHSPLPWGPPGLSPQCLPELALESCCGLRPSSPGLMPLRLSRGDQQSRKPFPGKGPGGQEGEVEAGGGGGYSAGLPQSLHERACCPQERRPRWLALAQAGRPSRDVHQGGLRAGAAPKHRTTWDEGGVSCPGGLEGSHTASGGQPEENGGPEGRGALQAPLEGVHPQTHRLPGSSCGRHGWGHSLDGKMGIAGKGQSGDLNPEPTWLRELPAVVKRTRDHCPPPPRKSQEDPRAPLLSGRREQLCLQ